MSSQANRGTHFEARVLEFGPIPPSGGPRRQRYLDASGRRALATTEEEFQAAIGILATLSEPIPAMHSPLVELDAAARVSIQRRKNREWSRFASVVDPALLLQVEPRIRRAEAAAVAALNFLEDHALAETAHQAVHRAAFVRRGLFGCPIVLRDGEFWTKCAFKLSHIRLGFSTGLIADFECSICDRLLEDCDHEMGMAYEKLAGKLSNGLCNLCESAQCGHLEGETYPIVAQGIGRKATAREVSMVPRPRYPQARFTGVTLDILQTGNAQLRRLAERVNIDCNMCLGPCSGLNDVTL